VGIIANARRVAATKECAVNPPPSILPIATANLNILSLLSYLLLP
jgi:hypothetical protein